jgi:hypothetical protein
MKHLPLTNYTNQPSRLGNLLLKVEAEVPQKNVKEIPQPD